MVEFKIKVHPEQRIAYIPKELFETLGTNLKAIGNRTAVVLFPENAALEDVARSLEIIQADLHHALQLKQKEGRQNHES